MVDTKLHEHHQIVIDNVVVSSSPASDTSATSALVGVSATSIELAIAVLHSIDVTVREFSTLVCEAVMIRNTLLEWRSMNLVGHRLSIDWVPYVGILDLESSVGVKVKIISARSLDESFLGNISSAVRVEVATRHSVCFIVDKTVGMAFKCRINTQRKDVLVVGSKYSRMNNGSPRDLNTLIDGLGGEDTGGANLVDDLASLVKHECKNVFVVGHSDDRLQNKFTVANDRSTTGTVVGMLPANTSILLMDTHAVGHFHSFTLVVRDDSREVVDRAKAVASKLQVVGHDSRTDITEVESSLLVVGVAWVGVRNVHVTQ